MNENTAQPLTRDDVRAIVSEEIGKVGDLLLLGGHLVASDGCLQGLNSGAKFRNDRAQRIWLAGLNDLIDPICEVPSDSHVFRQRSTESESGISKSHETSPSVDDAGAHSVGDGQITGVGTPASVIGGHDLSAFNDTVRGIGNAFVDAFQDSATSESVTSGVIPVEGSLSKRLYDSVVRKSEALGRVEKAERKLCNAREDLAHAENEQRDASAAYDTFIFGGAE